MAKFPVAGYAHNISYGWETSFGTISSTFDKAFGQGVKLTTHDIDNSVDYVYAVGSQELQRQYAKSFKGSWGVEFLLSDAWFLRSIAGAAPTTAGAGPYTHTWTTANGGISNSLSSMSINVASDLDTDSDKNLLGCVVNSGTISMAVDEAVKVKLDGTFANYTKDTSLTATVAPVEEPLYFQQASLELPTSTTITDVQSLELGFNRNPDPVYGLGSRFAQKVVGKQREWSIKANLTYESDVEALDRVLGSTTAAGTPSESATLKVTVTNGGATTSLRSYVITYANVFAEKLSLPISHDDVTKTDVTLRARSITSIVATNNTSAAL